MAEEKHNTKEEIKDKEEKKQEEEKVEEKQNKENQEENKSTKIQEVVPKEDFDDLTDRYKRILAEFENHRKRTAKERESMYNSVLADVIESILPILDNLENAAKVETADENYKKGIELVLKQFQDVLKAKGVQEIEAVGETFDPELHEAVGVTQDDTKGEKEIVQEYRKGYKIGHKVIRHSMVMVAN